MHRGMYNDDGGSLYRGGNLSACGYVRTYCKRRYGGAAVVEKKRGDIRITHKALMKG